MSYSNILQLPRQYRCACSSNRVTTDKMTLLTPAAAAAAVGTADSDADEAIL